MRVNVRAQDESLTSTIKQLKLAGRRRNFGAATKQLQKARLLAGGLTPPICMAYIKACVRCSQSKVAKAYKDYVEENFPSSQYCAELTSVFLREAIENLNMSGASDILRQTPVAEWQEADIREFLRGALKCGWIFEAFTVLRVSSKSQWHMQTIELIIELLFSIASEDSSSEIVKLQRSWRKRALKPSSFAEHLAKAQVKLLILMTKSRSNIDLTHDIKSMTKHLSKVRKKMEEMISSPNSEKLTNESDASSLRFWKLKLDYMELDLETLAKKRDSPVHLFFKATDHVLREMDHSVWSNRAHPKIWPHLYQLSSLKVPLPINDDRRVVWTTAEDLCLKSISGLTERAHEALRALQSETQQIINSMIDSTEPLMVELGAGDGLMVSRNRPKAHIILNELRWNRCSRMAWRLSYSNSSVKMSNKKIQSPQLILGGDGTALCREYFRDCCDRIEINFPEPPVNRDATDNWISKTLFTILRTSLKPRGIFQLVSDQRSLMEYIDAYIVGDLLKMRLWETSSLTGSNWNFETITDEHVLRELGSSFFGQLWSRGKKKVFKFALRKLVE